jgi:hypothetical protein
MLVLVAPAFVFSGNAGVERGLQASYAIFF